MLELRGLRKAFGAVQVTRGVSMRLEKGERRVVLGPNGAGKTTLFNMVAGALSPDSGEVLLDGMPVTRLGVARRARLGMARSFQRNNLLEPLTVRENLALAAMVARGWTGSLLRPRTGDAEVIETVAEVAALVGLRDLLDLPVRAASYGDRRRLEVGLALATRPKILLLDEPTSGVGPDMTERFPRLLRLLPPALTVLIIEHDLDLGFEIADRITVLDHGEVVFEGTPDETRASPVVREIYLGDWNGHA
jgi:ABC-type branched-subunit amino acid transport system ATPase component